MAWRNLTSKAAVGVRCEETRDAVAAYVSDLSQCRCMLSAGYVKLSRAKPS